MLRETAFGRFLLGPVGYFTNFSRDCSSDQRRNLSGMHLAMHASQQYDAVTIAILRHALDEVSPIRDF
jgi:hypothetical protein